MKCSVCGRGVEAGTLLRTNPLGLPGEWAHEDCGGVPDPEVADLIRVLEGSPIAAPSLTPTDRDTTGGEQ